MEAVALLDRARQAGLVVLRDGARLIVRGPKRLTDLAVHLLDHKTEVLEALNAEADPALGTALDVLPAAHVVAASQPAVSAQTIQPFGPAAPTAACRWCGALAWHRAGNGWTCGACHPPPGERHVAVTDAELDGTLFGLAERARFPRLALSPAVAVLPGQDAWRRFAVLTTSPSLRASALAALLGREPGEEG
jgi:hypothetical protein